MARKVKAMQEYDLKSALVGTAAPVWLQEQLELIKVSYTTPTGQEASGQLVVHRSVALELKQIMTEIYAAKFPIAAMQPVVAFGWDDEASMAANNSSAFNYRAIAGLKRLSWHSYGLAVDLNPLWNPYIRADLCQPAGSTYDSSQPGTILADGLVVKIFKCYGWEWGGDCWDDRVDYQHFQKPNDDLAKA